MSSVRSASVPLSYRRRTRHSAGLRERIVAVLVAGLAGILWFPAVAGADETSPKPTDNPPPTTAVTGTEASESLPASSDCAGISSDLEPIRDIPVAGPVDSVIEQRLVPEDGIEPARASVDVSVITSSTPDVSLGRRHHGDMMQIVGSTSLSDVVSVTLEHQTLCPGDTATIVVNKSGSASITIASQDGAHAMIGVAPPWAVDAAGKSVATHFEATGTRLTQVVDGRDHPAPIVFDPTYSLINCTNGYWTDLSAEYYLNMGPANNDTPYCVNWGMFYSTNHEYPVWAYETNVANDYGLIAVVQDGGCSYGPDTGWAWDFQLPCKAHDFCYEMRKASFSGTISDSNCDSSLYWLMEAHCNNRTFSGDCRIMRNNFYTAVTLPWVVTDPNPGVVNLQNWGTGRCMDIEGPSSNVNTPIQNWSCQAVSQMRWRIWPQPGFPGQFKIVSEFSGMCAVASPYYNVVVEQVCATYDYHRFRLWGVGISDRYTWRDQQGATNYCIAVPSPYTNGTNLTDPWCNDANNTHVWLILAV